MEAYDVLTSLVPLSSQALAEALELDQLEAIRTVISERILELERAAGGDKESKGGRQTSSGDLSDTPPSGGPAPLVGETEPSLNRKKGSRWDSDDDDADERRAKTRRQREEERVKTKRTRRKTSRSLTCTTCRSIDCYSFDRKLSEGTYGIVWRAVDADTGEYVAIKQIKFESKACVDGFPLAALRETNVLLRLRHPNIIHVREMVVGPRDEEDVDVEEGYPLFNVFMVMDYYQLDLRTIMSQAMKRHFHQSEVKFLLKQLLEAVLHMHKNWIMHRDLKPENLLYGPGGRLVVCDFGLARSFDDPPGNKYTSLVVSLHYRSPELLIEERDYDGRGVDMWSIGCIFAELLISTQLFPGESEAAMLNLIWHTLGTPIAEEVPQCRSWPEFQAVMAKKHISLRDQPVRRLREKVPPLNLVVQGPYLSDCGFDLLEKMLYLDPSKRIHAGEALAHDWFTTESPKPKNLGEMPEFIGS